MKKPFLCVIGASDVAIFCALALAAACTGTVGPIRGPSGQAGRAPSGGAGTGAPGSGGVTGAGATGAGASSAGSTGTGAAGGAPAMGDVGTIYPNPPAFAAAPGLLRRLTRNQF